MVINGKASQWIEVDSGVLQGSILGPLLFIIFINGIDEGIISDILKVADDTKLFGKLGSSKSRDRLKEDLRVLCVWSDTWQMQFDTDKCKVMHIGYLVSARLVLSNPSCCPIISGSSHRSVSVKSQRLRLNRSVNKVWG